MTTYVRLNPDRSDIAAQDIQDVLLVQQADPLSFIADTSSDVTYNFMCEALDDNAKDTDPVWRIQRVPKVSPFIFLWARQSATDKVSSDFVHKASDRLNLNYGPV